MGIERDNMITIVGLGYVGLPTALAFYEAGYKVGGIDISEKVIEGIKNGKSPLIDVSTEIEIPTNDDRWYVTTNYEDIIPKSDVILITVPTPVDDEKKPDLTYVKLASRSVISNLPKGQRKIVVLESTVYPGVTREVLGGICQELGMEQGKDIILAYCPERVDPGQTDRGVSDVAQIIGCDDEKIGKEITEMFGTITLESATYVGKLEVAEASKMVENLQRDIDIALANELAVVLPKLGIDVEQVLAAASTKWNFHRHTPGIGVGGHCIPVDPYYYISLAEKVGKPSLLSLGARKMNESMPYHVSEEVLSLLKEKYPTKEDRWKVLVLGYSYKPELGDTRETPVEDLTKSLSNEGVEVLVWDPLVDNSEMPTWIVPVEDPYNCRDIDGIILATAHKSVLSLDWERMKKDTRNDLIYDGRRVLSGEKMIAMGWQYSGVGVPSFDSDF
ncbi:MAG: nucleotide sugar dehydrogenase [Euryarchaeota archaeon]|nr:nucleotide sugar dehydrogenase [Euryarchaeota archaeon]|tara:strand:+ start:4370 stop:5707 length:1338 start_codon:yes stop_codon:yes gene_type:complete